MTRRTLLPLAGVALLATGCGDHPTATELPRSSSPALATSGEVTGTVGGALYSLSVPESWNGTLVLYAHGFNDVDEALGLPHKDQVVALRDELLRRGYAVGYSSFAENGFAVKNGMQTTDQLRGIFASSFGQPQRTLVAGHSLGGLVALGLAERFPEHYAGALPMCGIVDGSSTTIDYISTVRVLFDFFYPGALRGSLLDVPTDLTQQEVMEKATYAMTHDIAGGSLQGALAMAQIMVSRGTPIAAISGVDQATFVQTLVTTIVYDLVFHARGFADLYDRTHQHSPFDNRTEVYKGLPSPAIDAVNAGVQRYDRTPDAENYLEQWYEPTGQLRIPVLTLHNAFDPVAGLYQEGRYAKRVQDTGASALLAQRVGSTPYGHCVFSVTEMADAVDHLARWVETGTRP